MNIPTPETEQLQLLDNYGLWHIPFWQKTWFMVLMVILGLVLLGVGSLLLVKYTRSKKKKLSPWQQALHDLKDLKKKRLLSVEHSGAFYTQLTHILKRFISYYYKSDVCSFTDQQMIPYVDALELFDKQKKSLKDIFSAGELIKFANQEALGKQMQDDWQFVYDFMYKQKEKDHMHEKRN